LQRQVSGGLRPFRGKGGTLLRLVALLALSLSSLLAQSGGKLSGKVTDDATGEPLPGCNVVIAGTVMGASTDADGTYFILNVPPGKYDVQTSVIGYRKIMERGVIVNSGKTTVVNFKLRLTELIQNEVVIESTRPDEIGRAHV
jgi:hypothetical protein